MEKMCAAKTGNVSVRESKEAKNEKRNFREKQSRKAEAIFRRFLNENWWHMGGKGEFVVEIILNWQMRCCVNIFLVAQQIVINAR